jgi:hypothetical protein
MLKARIGMSIKETAKGSTIEILETLTLARFSRSYLVEYSAKSLGECDSLRTERTADDLLSLTRYCGEVFIRSDGKRLDCNLAGTYQFLEVVLCGFSVRSEIWRSSLS